MCILRPCNGPGKSLDADDCTLKARHAVGAQVRQVIQGLVAPVLQRLVQARHRGSAELEGPARGDDGHELNGIACVTG